uniref:glucuronosyltransferase n=1 Tax=Panagrolaimus davidi TaxID=227884 RepID=A0A914P3P8_9BILA
MDYVGYYMGAPMPPSYVAPILSDAGDILTFGQRFKSIIGHSITPYVINKITLAAENKIFKKHFGADFPDLLEIAKNASLVFVNSNELYDLPRPTLHKIVNIGGLGMKAASAKPLEKEYAEKVEKAENVIVFTFGSAANSSHMPQKWKNAFMNAFSKFPKTQFFFRYEGTDLKAPKNVHLSKWLPQVDLLRKNFTYLIRNSDQCCAGHCLSVPKPKSAIISLIFEDEWLRSGNNTAFLKLK